MSIFMFYMDMCTYAQHFFLFLHPSNSKSYILLPYFTLGVMYIKIWY